MLDRILIGSSAEPSDPNFENVTLLLHGDGSNGAQNNTFIDSSTNNFTITRNGNTTQGSFSPYGSNWSNYFDGSGDYLNTPSNSAFAFGTGDFTIEGWVFTTGTATTWRPIMSVGAGSAGNLIRINQSVYTSGYLGVLFPNDTNNGDLSYDTGSALPRNQWVHLALVRNGSTLTLYQNGTNVLQKTVAFNFTNTTGASIGYGMYSGDGYFEGYMSNVRILKGTALYTSNFTPSTTPLTAITNTSLLTCADNRFRDGSTNNFTITRNGDVKVTNFAPFAPSSAYSTTTNGGSAYFDGTGDYLTAAANTAFDVGTGDFTIEFWGYWNAVSSTIPGNVCHCVNNGTLGIYIVDSAIQLARYNTGGDLTATVTQTVGQWDHYAITRQSGTARIFKNGALLASGSVTTNYGQNGFQIGTGASSAVNGYISNFRFVKGTAVYTAAFTPPTSPVTAISGTSLLLNATNAAIFDNSMKNDLETVGNAQISTSVKKFGTGSMYFDGSGDVIVAPYSVDWTMGSASSWTVELWFYSTSSASGNRALLRTGTGGYAGIAIVQNASNLFVDLSTSGSGWNWSTGAKAITTNTWNHLAIVRNGATTTAYLNGTSYYSASSVDIWNSSEPLTIGATNSAGSADAYIGYIDELRFTKGVARYTANFTAPTAPFPNK